MNKIILLSLIALNSFSFNYDTSYDSTGWSGKIFGENNTYQKALYKCAKNEGLSRENFVSHISALGFIGNKNGKKGISFLSNNGVSKFVPWESLPKNQDKVYFALGKFTFLGEKTKEGTWYFEDFPTSSAKLNGHVAISTSPEEDLSESLINQLFAETNKSINLLNQSSSGEKINSFSTSLIDCLKVAKFNKDKDYIANLQTSSELMTIANKKDIAKEFESTKTAIGLENIGK